MRKEWKRKNAGCDLHEPLLVLAAFTEVAEDITPCNDIIASLT